MLIGLVSCQLDCAGAAEKGVLSVDQPEETFIFVFGHDAEVPGLLHLACLIDDLTDDLPGCHAAEDDDAPLFYAMFFLHKGFYNSGCGRRQDCRNPGGEGAITTLRT